MTDNDLSAPARAAREHGLRSDRLRVLACGGVLLVLILTSLRNTPYWNFQLSLVMVWAVAALGLNLVSGYLGEVSVGHGAFFAVGAYVMVYAYVDLGVPLLLVLAAAAVAGFVVGLVVGFATRRLRGLYLAMLTLALGVGMLPILKRMSGLTGGVTGRSVPQPSGPEWLGLASDQFVFVLTVLCGGLALLVCWWIARGELGRSLAAVRETDVAAAALGVNTGAHRLFAFAMSAMLAAVAGALYALVVGFVAPGVFAVFLSINLLVAVVVGGGGTLLGPVVGAVFIQFMPILAGEYDQSISGLVYGLLLIAAMLVMPAGFVGLVRRLGSGIGRMVRSRSADRGVPRSPSSSPSTV